MLECSAPSRCRLPPGPLSSACPQRGSGSRCGQLCKPRRCPAAGRRGLHPTRPLPGAAFPGWRISFGVMGRNIGRQGPNSHTAKGGRAPGPFSPRAPPLLSPAAKGAGPRTLTFAGGRPSSVTPRAVWLAHGCGLLSGLKLKALVAFVRHFTVQRELRPREGAVPRGLWDATGHG